MEIALQCRRLMHKLRLAKTWWTRRHRAYQPLFVVATCRSGSNLLVSQLAQQPGVGLKSELLYPGDYRGIWRYKTSPAAAVRHLRYSLHALNQPVRGCKLMLYQLANCQLEIEDIQDAFPGARYVILYRQNLAEQYVS